MKTRRLTNHHQTGATRGRPTKGKPLCDHCRLPDAKLRPLQFVLKATNAVTPPRNVRPWHGDAARFQRQRQRLKERTQAIAPAVTPVTSRTLQVCPACWDELHEAAGFERQALPAGSNHDADAVREFWVHPTTGRRRAVAQKETS